MTVLTRRQTLIGAAATVAAASVLPAVAKADVANGEVMLDPRHRFRDVVVGYTDRNGCEWFGREWFGHHDFVEMVRALDEADLITDYELVDFSGDRVMTIAKEDIEEGWYWVRNREERKHCARVAGTDVRDNGQHHVEGISPRMGIPNRDFRGHPNVRFHRSHRAAGGNVIDIMDTILARIKASDHKVFRIPADEEIADAILDEMDAAGYVFACSPAALEGQGFREVYFVPAEPTSRLTP